jgi:hypothetical protein
MGSSRVEKDLPKAFSFFPMSRPCHIFKYHGFVAFDEGVWALLGRAESSFLAVCCPCPLQGMHSWRCDY